MEEDLGREVKIKRYVTPVEYDALEIYRYPKSLLGIMLYMEFTECESKDIESSEAVLAVSDGNRPWEQVRYTILGGGYYPTWDVYSYHLVISF